MSIVEDIHEENNNKSARATNPLLLGSHREEAQGTRLLIAFTDDSRIGTIDCIFSEINCELKTSIFIIARFDVTCCKIVNDDSSFFLEVYKHNKVIERLQVCCTM